MRHNLVRRALATALLAGLVAACAPQSPDHTSWDDQARLALQDTRSEVSTVKLLLELQQQDKVPGKYQQVVAQDSETAVGATMASFGGEQPVPADDYEYRFITGLISDASDVLSDARIAVVRRDEQEYPRLIRQLGGLQKRLTLAQQRVAR